MSLKTTKKLLNHYNLFHYNSTPIKKE